jgi:hypothetical protein
MKKLLIKKNILNETRYSVCRKILKNSNKHQIQSTTEEQVKKWPNEKQTLVDPTDKPEKKTG